MPIESPREAGLDQHPLMRTDFNVSRVMNIHHPRAKQYTPDGVVAISLRSSYISLRGAIVKLQRSSEVKARLTWEDYTIAYRGFKLSYPQVIPDRNFSIKYKLTWEGSSLSNGGFSLSHAEKIKSSYPRVTLEDSYTVIKTPLSWSRYSIYYNSLALTYPQTIDNRVETPLSSMCDYLAHGGLLLTYPQ